MQQKFESGLIQSDELEESKALVVDLDGRENEAATRELQINSASCIGPVAAAPGSKFFFVLVRVVSWIDIVAPTRRSTKPHEPTQTDPSSTPVE